MRLRTIRTLAARELRAAVRGRQFLVSAAAFALLAVAVAKLGMGGAEEWGIHALDRTAAALLNLVLLFVPLLALPLGAASFAGEAEDGTLGYLVAQPVTRGEVFAGKLAGLAVSVTLSLALGFGAAAVLIGARGGISSGTYLALTGAAWLLGLVTTAIGAALAILARNRARALAAAIGAWLALVFLCDFGVLALAAAQVLGGTALLAVAVLNPLEAVKTLAALAISERLEILGPAGVHAARALGRPGLAALLVAVALAWMAGSTGIAWLRFKKESFA